MSQRFLIVALLQNLEYKMFRSVMQNLQGQWLKPIDINETSIKLMNSIFLSNSLFESSKAWSVLVFAEPFSAFLCFFPLHVYCILYFLLDFNSNLCVQTGEMSVIQLFRVYFCSKPETWSRQPFLCKERKIGKSLISHSSNFIITRDWKTLPRSLTQLMLKLLAMHQRRDCTSPSSVLGIYCSQSQYSLKQCFPSSVTPQYHSSKLLFYLPISLFHLGIKNLISTMVQFICILKLLQGLFSAKWADNVPD